jgi:hypothetical protein
MSVSLIGSRGDVGSGESRPGASEPMMKVAARVVLSSRCSSPAGRRQDERRLLMRTTAGSRSQGLDHVGPECGRLGRRQRRIAPGWWRPAGSRPAGGVRPAIARRVGECVPCTHDRSSERITARGAGERSTEQPNAPEGRSTAPDATSPSADLGAADVGGASTAGRLVPQASWVRVKAIDMV